jgi:transcriptional regulator with XRE-family HTH domain
MSDKLTIFGQNLRALCRRKPSISSVARDLEVGRVQFGRYLNGTSFPKPDLLDRICRYFNVDVAIFIRPLDEIEAEQKDWMKKANDLAYLQSAASYIEESTTYEGFSRHLPDGIHCLWLNSFSDLSSVHCRLMQVRTVDGTRLIKGYDRVGRLISDNFPAPLLKRNTAARSWLHLTGSQFSPLVRHLHVT